MKTVEKHLSEIPIHHTPCSYPGCTEVRMTSDLAESKPYCTDHIEEMPYVREILMLLGDINPNEERKRADQAFKALDGQ
jgi:hypothetical protein